jgi:hypothetical protein
MATFPTTLSTAAYMLDTYLDPTTLPGTLGRGEHTTGSENARQVPTDLILKGCIGRLNFTVSPYFSYSNTLSFPTIR